MITQQDIINGYDDERWHGWGYFGERRNQTDEAAVAVGDAVAIAAANQLGWDRETFFEWLNSRLGRHFGNFVFGAKTADGLVELAIKCRYFDVR